MTGPLTEQQRTTNLWGPDVPPEVAMRAALRELGMSPDMTDPKSAYMMRFAPAAGTAFRINQAGRDSVNPETMDSDFRNFLISGIRDGTLANGISQARSGFSSVLQRAREASVNGDGASTGNTYLDALANQLGQDPREAMNTQAELLNPFIGRDMSRAVHGYQSNAMSNAYINSQNTGKNLMEILFGLGPLSTPPPAQVAPPTPADPTGSPNVPGNPTPSAQTPYDTGSVRPGGGGGPGMSPAMTQVSMPQILANGLNNQFGVPMSSGQEDSYSYVPAGWQPPQDPNNFLAILSKLFPGLEMALRGAMGYRS